MKKLVVLLALCVASCDANKELDNAFATYGLTRINALRTDYSPGTIILRGKKRTIFAGNILDYVIAGSLSLQSNDRTAEVDGILPGIKTSKNINPSLATNFLASAIPVNGTLDLKFTSNVNVDQVNCRVLNVKISDLQAFIKDPQSAKLVEALASFRKENAEIYVAYEVWQASTIKLSSSAGSNIDSEVKVGEIKPLSSADAKFSYAKTDESSLTVSGDRYYAFALRLAKIDVNPQTNAVNVTFTDFKMPGEVKAIRDEGYSAVPGPAGSFTVESVSKAQIAAKLTSD